MNAPPVTAPIDRSAGILLHLTSLPGPAYTGDIGPAATHFADFLSRNNQRVWQLLPIQPTTAQQGYSPYSSYSSMAANMLLISPELLVQQGWINASDIIQPPADDHSDADFDRACSYKQDLLNKAWTKWRVVKNAQSTAAFETFCKNEHYWLHDYALYSVIKSVHDHMPWYDWPEELRDRNANELAIFADKHADEIGKTKWIQMVFRDQWNVFRSYCNKKNIRLFGDIPMYVAHDSADVWSNRHIFTLNEDGSMSAVAGVPPDLFNDEGQLWGMPLFRWDVVEQTGYKWWIDRLRKNFEWFDMLRLDHFRAFSSFWKVPARAKTAKEGHWMPGPGKAFFDAVEASLGKLNLVAEDLGEIDAPVYELRDQLNLPGMNVLQFAFDDMPKSNYLPHRHTLNSVTYTGTHDNNTTVGWYQRASRKEKQNVAAYTGVKTTTNNISDHLARLAYASVSSLTILPMQDILSLGESARMNTPATAAGNWTWRLKDDWLLPAIETKLTRWTYYFDRGGQ